ncbi:hypothetical protein Bca52824_089460 [Brassica carinata]|uniref:Uncharacterized protein n=1 Tax=Brassica carinata TaxID=52824 RepID=A0A8X7PF86_BRACI|nr:hypothetical protein Bca52824_089460 [Brassica carinata]
MDHWRDIHATSRRSSLMIWFVASFFVVKKAGRGRRSEAARSWSQDRRKTGLRSSSICGRRDGSGSESDTDLVRYVE